ncbi:GGDEF domain-containing protein [Stutzerimonas frequens]|uniref:GGDEF domain-containing protein n=1 Tax=Stutzerimonas frequens TaxID=2968969 RepID=UPI004037C9FE
MRLSLLPANDPAQKLRIKRFSLSVFMYALCAVPLCMAVYFGFSPARVVIHWAVISMLGNGGFYLVFRLGYNKRFKDASLTTAQMLLAIALILYTQIYAGPVRGAYLLGLMIVVVFGCFKLRTRQLLLMSVISSVLYAATLPIIYSIEGERFDWAAELILWATFTAFLPFLSILTGVISNLRRELAASGTKLQEALATVTELATRDELTGAYNRRWLMDMLERERSRADRGGEAFCICLADLDHFKRVNDTHGHSAGDTVLKSFAATAMQLLRGSDVLARYGGEEFLLFLPQASLESAGCCVDRLRKRLAATPFEGLPSDLRITLSAGVTRYRPGEDIAVLIDRADQALYRAKLGGRDRVELAP